MTGGSGTGATTFSPPVQRLRRFGLQRGWPVIGAASRLARATLARRKPVIAVVGSYGKTTTTAAIAAALGLPRPRFGNAFAGPALDLLLRGASRKPLALEVGIGRKGQMIRHARAIRPDIVVVTSIGTEHARSLGDQEGIREEKARIFAGMRSGGVAFLNGDDPHVRAMARHVPGVVVTFGFGADNDVRLLDRQLDWPYGTRLEIDRFGERVTVRTRLLGRIAAYPVLAALAVAHRLGHDRREAVAGLERLEPTPGRLRLTRLPQGNWLLGDEHKGNLETIHAALDVLEEIPARRLVVMGEIHEPPGSVGPLYRALGARLAGIATHVVMVGSRKSFLSLRSGARQAGLSPEVFTHAGREWRKAFDILTGLLQPEDVLLVKGRDRQRLMRLSLALTGRPVSCGLVDCALPMPGCHVCPRL
ncbi:MAG TPA: hypothetical protein ENJ38_00615 [Rhodospirillales bacterium]|nr:hypothetical protein [Rhodospirillales bacterium]